MVLLHEKFKQMFPYVPILCTELGLKSYMRTVALDVGGAKNEIILSHSSTQASLVAYICGTHNPPTHTPLSMLIFFTFKWTYTTRASSLTSKREPSKLQEGDSEESAFPVHRVLTREVLFWSVLGNWSKKKKKKETDQTYIPFLT